MILCRVWSEGILEVYDIMGYEGTLYIPHNGDIASFWCKQNVLLICMMVLVLVHSLSLYVE